MPNTKFQGGYLLAGPLPPSLVQGALTLNLSVSCRQHCGINVTIMTAEQITIPISWISSMLVHKLCCTKNQC